MHDDKTFLDQALDLAWQGSQAGDGGPFGAVVVRNGTVVAHSWNRVIVDTDPTAHAEIGAIRKACRQSGHFHLTGCTLYASSEPCPMCLAAAYWARIERIVFAFTRSEAATIGFCDDELYDQLALPFNERRIVMEHHPLPGAPNPLAHWAQQPGHIHY